MHLPPMHTAETHSLVLVHAVRQAVDPQMYDPQLRVTAGQFPAPSQVAARVCEPPEQLADPQLLDVPGNTHEGDAPSQSLAHVPLPPVHVPCPARGVPAMLAHVPGECPDVVSAHDWHVSLQAMLQQTPSMQKPLVH